MNNDNKFYIPINGKMEADPNYNNQPQNVEMPVLKENVNNYNQQQPQDYYQETNNYNNYNNYQDPNNYNNGYNYNQQPQNSERTNTLAIVGLVLALVMGPVGGVVSIIALKQIKETGEKGRGLAIAGIIIGFLLIAIVVLIAAISVIFSTLLWPSVKSNIQRSTYCSQAYSCTDNYDGTETCKYLDEYNEENEIVCQKGA